MNLHDRIAHDQQEEAERKRRMFYEHQSIIRIWEGEARHWRILATIIDRAGFWAREGASKPVFPRV